MVASLSPLDGAVFARAGLSAAVLDEPRRIARTRSDALWQAATDHTGPDLPLRVAERVGPRSYGHFSHLLASAPTVGASLRALCRYYPPLMGNTTAHRLDTARGCVRLTVDPLGKRPRCVDLFSVAVVATFVRRVAGVVPQRARAPVSPAQLGTTQRALRCPVDGTTSRLELEYAVTDLSMPLSGHDPALHDLLLEHARWRTETTSSTHAQVEARIRDLGPRPDLRAHEVAAALGTSLRTLRRRLAAESTSFQAVLDDLLREAAVEFLRHTTVDDTARALGYADGSALRRAHRRWFGTSPRALTPRASRSR